ncbi:TAXI family TRAP transporter solute-binding subunit [Kushneria aurantia]|uniref:TAXI family TRAP transporter solute-binding subunit n=1 Tax=Kushneria aurantia TaxID=504092 RepID=A0ABV6G5W1_9GAMM|nr:TAXI family TRAP transporter solute-binding subunit [Kushneria aurantia]
MDYRVGLVAASLTLLALSGCGGGDDSEQQSGTDQQNQGSSEQQSQSGSSAQSSSAQNGTDSASSSEAAEPVRLVFGTGGTSGAYYALGGALKSVFEQSPLVSNVQVVSTGASVQNIQNIQDGLNQLAIVMSDVAYDALNGQNHFEGNAADITAIAGLYPNVVQVVAMDGSDINSISDLAGKRVGVGQVGSGVEASARIVMESAGLEYSDLARVSHTGYADSVTEMSNGNLDAAFFTSGVPNSNITGLMQSSNIHFVEIDGDTAEQLMADYPYYQTYEIPAGAPERYNLDEAVDTVSIRNLLIAPASMRNDVAEQLAQRFEEYLGSEQVAVGALREIDPASLDQNLILPVHPGAAMFYEQMHSQGSTGDSGSGDTQSNGSSDTQGSGS